MTIVEHKPLTPGESDALAAHEAVIARGLQTFYEVGNALAMIRDDRLYRTEYSAFEEYCQSRWGMSRIHAHRLIEASEVRERLLPMGNTLPMNERQARPLSALPIEQQGPAWQRVVETAPSTGITAAHVAQTVEQFRPPQLAAHQLINQSTNDRWFTPAAFRYAAHDLMGGIDLDPASEEYANRIVRAAQFYSESDNGLVQPWAGRVWLNPPYGIGDGESNQARWSRRLIEEYRAGRVTEALLLVNAVTGNNWFAPLKHFPICFPDSRIRFYNESTEASAPTHSNAIVYFGPQVARFAAIFGRFGAVLATRDVWEES